MTTLTHRTCPACSLALTLDDFDLVWQPDGTRALADRCATCVKRQRSQAGLRDAFYRRFRPLDQRIGGKEHRPPDKGCELAPSCLACPLSVCIHDLPQPAQRAITQEARA